MKNDVHANMLSLKSKVVNGLVGQGGSSPMIPIMMVEGSELYGQWTVN